jgi:hypothetical protein
VTLETGRWKTRRDLPVWVALVVLLTVGWVLKSGVEGRTTAFADSGGSLRIRYPAGWLAVPGSTALLEVQDPFSRGGVPTSLIVTREPRPPERTPSEIATAGALAHNRQLDIYRVISAEPTRVAGKDAVAVRYAFVADPHKAVLDLQRIPVVVRGVELFVPVDGTVYRIDFRADTTEFDAARPVLDRMLREIQL